MTRLAWAGVAVIAALVATGFAITAATVALAGVVGTPAAVLMMVVPLSALAALGGYLAWRAPPAAACTPQPPM